MSPKYAKQQEKKPEQSKEPQEDKTMTQPEELQ